MPKFTRIALSLIDEPAMPVRISMDDRKMDELCQSMSDIGLLQPIGLKHLDGRYEIEFGHRRFIAAQRLKWREIPALVFTAKELQDGAAMLAENVEREDITAAEEAVLFTEAQEKYNLDEAGLMTRFRRSANYIAERLTLLRRDPEVFKALQQRKISFGAAKELNKCTDEGHRRYLLDSAIRSEAGQKVIASWVAQWKASIPQNIPATDPAAPAPPRQIEINHGIECAFCGGYRDPYNMVSIYVHKWELDEIRKVMRQPPIEEISKTAVPAAND